MAQPKTIGSSLTVLLVSDTAKSQAYYRDVLGFDVTDWWAERDGLNGLALKLLQAASPEDVRPKAAAKGSSVGVDIYAYVDTWAKLESLYKEFKEKGAFLAQDIVTYPDGGPWKEFIVRDPDGYGIAIGGVDGRPGGMRSPIRPHVGAVRLAVRDLDRAVERYARLLDLNVNPVDRFDGKLHTFKLENGTDLVLEARDSEDRVDDARISPSSSQSFTVYAADIDAAYNFSISAGFEEAEGIDRTSGQAHFRIRDDDGNKVIVVQSQKARVSRRSQR
ncbi:VOC family protein [Paenibacillus hodogayensis]|uniref:VOC family protein n=1 Tax=Paenibacillus hodogayensis TaxID=279208 RepID=A0ABV5VV77_9BACL